MMIHKAFKISIQCVYLGLNKGISLKIHKHVFFISGKELCKKALFRPMPEKVLHPNTGISLFLEKGIPRNNINNLIWADTRPLPYS